MPVIDALPFGARDLKVTPYADALGTTLGVTSYDLPNLQTLSFSETEDYEELRGDDRLVATHGNGASLTWSIDAGGLSLVVWSILSGGSIISSGLTPNRKDIMRKKGSDQRPYFRIDGQAISDSGGDVVARLYRCKCNDTIDGEFSDGSFYTTSVSGLGLPLLDDGNDLLYDLIRSETKQTLALTPEANPVPVPRNLTVGAITGSSPSASVVLTWTEVIGATGYKVQKSTTSATTGFSAAPVQPITTATTATETGNATGTVYYRVCATVAGVDSEFSTAVSAVIP